MKKGIIPILLCVIMLAAVFPANAFAANADIKDDTYTLTLKSSKKALNVYAETVAKADKNGTNVTVWAQTGHVTQQFTTKALGDGKYHIYALSGKSRVLDVLRKNSKVGRPIEIGGNVQLWANDDPAAQEWNITYKGDGYYSIGLAAVSGTAIGCTSANQDGGNVVLQKYTGSDNQLWQIKTLSGEIVKPESSTLKCSGFTLTDSIMVGSFFTVSGTVSSNLNISKILVKVIDKASGAAEISEYAYLNSKSYNLSEIDKRILFNKLSVGDKRISIIAWDDAGEKTVYTKDFAVKGNSGWVLPLNHPVITDTYLCNCSYHPNTSNPHNGMDLDDYGDHMIKASNAGTVINVSFDRSRGNFVVIQHSNGYYSQYQHLANNSVKVKIGDKVTAGQSIATMGSTGKGTGTHLHFEIGTTVYNKIISKHVNPSNVVSFKGIKTTWGTYPYGQ